VKLLVFDFVHAKLVIVEGRRLLKLLQQLQAATSELLSD
jgi:hypothetical protein